MKREDYPDDIQAIIRTIEIQTGRKILKCEIELSRKIEEKTYEPVDIPMFKEYEDRGFCLMTIKIEFEAKI